MPDTTPTLRDRLTRALDECRTMIPAAQADVVLSVLRRATQPEIKAAVAPARLVLGTTDQQHRPPCTDGDHCGEAAHCPPESPAYARLQAAASKTSREMAGATLRAYKRVYQLATTATGPIEPCAVLDALKDDEDPTAARARELVEHLVLGTTDQQPEAHRLALSDALGLGTGAPWDAIRDAAAGYRRTLAEADQRKQEYKQACIRLRAEVERLRTDRAAVLREAAALLVDHASTLEALSSSDYDNESFAANHLRGKAVDLHRMADEAQQPETEAHPVQTEWIGEVLELDGAWEYLGASSDRSVAERRRASITRRHPDVQTRTIRKVTTYTVAADQPDTETEATK